VNNTVSTQCPAWCAATELHAADLATTGTTLHDAMVECLALEPVDGITDERTVTVGLGQIERDATGPEPATVTLDGRIAGEPMSPDDARRLAAGLLFAAQLADHAREAVTR
jgi:hypothetical protein